MGQSYLVAVQAAGIGILAECGYEYQRSAFTEHLGYKVDGLGCAVGYAKVIGQNVQMIGPETGQRFGIGLRV